MCEPPVRRATYLPKPEEELLLKAALLDGDVALKAWEAWRSRVSLDDIDHASARLVPLLLDNLQRLCVRHPDLQRYQNVARHTWLENQLLAKHGVSILQLFSDAAIPAMPLKGLAVTPLYYGNFRLRAMSDIDILVPTEAARDAAQLLVAHGWRSSRHYRMRAPDYFSTAHSTLFKNAHDVQLDLHWHVFHECCRPNADDIFWSQSRPMILNGLQTRSLCDTDQLFHACAHGGRPNRVAPFRWVADSAMILRAASIDWERLLSHAQTFHLVLRLQRTLGYLREAIALAIPTDVLAELQALPVTGIENFEERIEIQTLPEIAKMLPRRYAHYRRTWISDGKAGFLRYLEASYGTRSFVDTLRWGWRQVRSGKPI